MVKLNIYGVEFGRIRWVFCLIFLTNDILDLMIMFFANTYFNKHFLLKGFSIRTNFSFVASNVSQLLDHWNTNMLVLLRLSRTEIGNDYGWVLLHGSVIIMFSIHLEGCLIHSSCSHWYTDCNILVTLYGGCNSSNLGMRHDRLHNHTVDTTGSSFVISSVHCLTTGKIVRLRS